MRLRIKIALALSFTSILLSCLEEQEIPVTIDIDYVVPQQGYTVPVSVSLINRTSGADFYRWTFQGGSPNASDQKDPGLITYNQAGEYTIVLEAWNDTQRARKEITLQLDSAVTIDFDYAIQINDIAPADVEFTNLTVGASSFHWEFEGGTPSSSTDRIPSPVHYAAGGEYLVSLTVSNGRESFSKTKTVSVRPAMVSSFEIIPSFEDEDYEAPLTAFLNNATTNALSFAWSCEGGVLSDPSATNPSLYLPSPGDYTVTLVTDNGKDTRTVSRSITVKENSNLFVAKDVRFGISAAQHSVGCFYSSGLRRVLAAREITSENALLVDIAFFAINSGFSYCRFVSPDSAAKFGLTPLASPTHSFIANTLENTSIELTADAFDQMQTDSILESLDIADNDSKTSFFTAALAPRIVLFETADGRKGAIKIKAFVGDGPDSYVLADIKVQKEPRL